MEPHLPKPERKRVVFPTKNELSVAMAKYTANLSEKFYKKRGYFTVVLSGGDLISWLSELLKPKYLECIEWSKWHIFWVDDRVVPWDDKDSNYKQATNGFLSKVPIPIGNIHAIDQTCAGLGDAKGMGHDGHMASLFPNHYQINEKASLVTYITDSPKLPPKRITFTLPVINCASYNLMAVCDETQADAIAKVFSNDLDLPAARLTGDIEAIWYLDEAAASKIPKKH
ncbi:unnamed protein product [Cochlearia groenlandica]